MEHARSIARTAYVNRVSGQDLISWVASMPNLKEIEFQHNARMNRAPDPNEGSQFSCDANITLESNKSPSPNELVDMDMLRRDPNRFTK